MRTSLLAFATLLATELSGFAQNTPGAILEEYRAKSGPIFEKLNATLTRQATSIAADLVSKGDTTGAETIQEQLKAKVAGEAVLSPHYTLATLFQQYDTARETSLKPIQTASIAKIDVMLKTSAGKELATVTELARVRKEVETTVAEAPAKIAEEWAISHFAHWAKDGRLNPSIRRNF